MRTCTVCDTEFITGYQSFCSKNCFVYNQVDEELTEFARRFKEDELAENGDNINAIFDLFKEHSKDLFQKELLQQFSLDNSDLELLMVLANEIDPKEYDDEALVRANQLVNKLTDIILKLK